MNKWILGWLILALMGPLSSARGQAEPGGRRAANLQVGGGGLLVLTDYAARPTEGAAVWADFDLSPHLGLEGSLRLGGLHAPDRIAERTYSVGPRLSFRTGNWNLFSSIGFGQGTIRNLRYRTASTYNLLSYSVGLEYRVAPRVNLRLAQVRREHWLAFPPHGLAPFSLVVGASYDFR